MVSVNPLGIPTTNIAARGLFESNVECLAANADLISKGRVPISYLHLFKIKTQLNIAIFR